MKNICSLLSVLTFLSASSLRAIDLPGSSLWSGLLLGQVDTNGDTILDSGEIRGGFEAAFAALDPSGEGFISAAKVDAVKDPIAKTLGDSGAELAVSVIKMILGVDEGGKQLSLEDFMESASSLSRRLDTNGDASLDEGEIRSMPTVLLAWKLSR